MSVRCQQSPVLAGSATLAALGALVLYLAEPSGYGKYSENLMPVALRLPARAAWFLQELPSFAVPAGILAGQPSSLLGPPATVLLGLFCAHYFHRTFVYSLLTRGRPFPVVFLFRGFVFCMGNGLLQGYYLVYCAEYPAEWYTDIRFSLGIFLFILGMGINIHSDYILRQLRKPGEIIYRIPQGGLFTYVSGANFLDSTSRCLMTTPSLEEPSFHSSFKETKEQGNKTPTIPLKTIKLLSL
ncbi:3-oxo-5-alpha-steroid 4-dehydrogenase 2 isoform X2 [Bubalus bubalis]|uniref:3-oxo-5-alpha-steroid 4-dehydrogenase 2 isoform X2 n=1 Tax=Bubalus bubalis TaxID=89462 RepID=UPI001D115AE4|nr:3-oxo-5-alpha-steroid 4-dehydrogenase 2 isoform X2 [Bubalus bubalis]XP_006054832.3 3-oxo-5-alpha-steroid 4-dehydrogenase 2 isoform X2 [Bubalus bubalis]XP_025116630.2 3-oxo-5-alpha-steroid 4-dehydrogenase 2 isoform X2 [Bubalus bubalis]